MYLDAISQVGAIPDAQYYSTNGYGSISWDVYGTISAGDYIPEGSNDGNHWATLSLAKDGALVTPAIIGSTGHWSANCVAYSLVRLRPENSLAGNGTLTANIVQPVQPPFTVGF